MKTISSILPSLISFGRWFDKLRFNEPTLFLLEVLYGMFRGATLPIQDSEPSFARLFRVHGPVDALSILFVDLQPFFVLRLPVRCLPVLVNFVTILVHVIQKTFKSTRRVLVSLLHKPKHYLEIHPCPVSVESVRTHAKIVCQIDPVVVLQPSIVQHLFERSENDLFHVLVGTGIRTMAVMIL